MTVTLNNVDMATVLGIQFPSRTSVSAANHTGSQPAAIAVAKIGTLTTRTDANTGELTMAASHGITTGARLDLYWTGGSRRGITVGTVATNAVPIDLGAGDDLPTNNTAITAMVPTEEAFVVTGSNVTALLVYSDVAGQVTFCLTDDTEVKSYEVGGGSTDDQSYVWTTARDATNPLAASAVTKVYFSHGSSSSTATMKAIALHD